MSRLNSTMRGSSSAPRTAGASSAATARHRRERGVRDVRAAGRAMPILGRREGGGKGGRSVDCKLRLPSCKQVVPVSADPPFLSFLPFLCLFVFFVAIPLLSEQSGCLGLADHAIEVLHRHAARSSYQVVLAGQ